MHARDTSSWKRYTIMTCGTVAIAGCVLVSVADLVGVVLTNHNPISETISKLAIGESAWIQDFGLDAYAIGVFALAVGLFFALGGGWRFYLGLVFLIALGVDILLIAEHNQYAGRPGRGAAIHIYLVYALYALLATISGLLAESLRHFGEGWRWGSYLFAGLWLILAPFFFFVPGSVDGAYERFLALFLLVSVGGVGWRLFAGSRNRGGSA